MPASGLAVFNKTLQTTNVWLNEVAQALGPDRQHAWKVLSTVLHKLRDRLPLGDAVHLGAQLPLLVRGVYYDQFMPFRQPTDWNLDQFVTEVGKWLSDTRPTDARGAVSVVFLTLSRHLTPGEVRKVQNTLPKDIRDFWTSAEATSMQAIGQDKPTPGTNGAGRRARSSGANQRHKGEMAMKVYDAMTPSAQTIHPNDTLQHAAQIMCDCDIGFLPVGAGDRLVGMITDRDISVRAVAGGYSPMERVGDFMTRDVKYCFEDDELDEVLDNMSELKVRRLPVVNRRKRLVGVLSLTDAALEGARRHAGEALSVIGRPGGAHSQTPAYTY